MRLGSRRWRRRRRPRRPRRRRRRRRWTRWRRSSRRGNQSTCGLRHGSKKVLLCGDLDGDLNLLQRLLQDLKDNGTDIDLVFCVGRFVPSSIEVPREDFLRSCQELQLPAPVFFVDVSCEDLIATSQTRDDCIPLGPHIFFLGAYGIRDIEGLKVAFLSGKHRPESYRESGPFLEPDGRGRGATYTAAAPAALAALAAPARDVDDMAFQEVCVLLTSEWPETYWSTAKKAEAMNPVEAQHRSPAVRDIFFELKPRYHVCASANLHRLRKASQGPHGFVCTSVALCQAFSESDAEATDAKKWFHVMGMRPSCPEKYSLLSEAAQIKVKSQAKSAISEMQLM
ncbi:unnamed protein product [Effrenium voratum]|nr:unnamed protein product [Effrenium voratum]